MLGFLYMPNFVLILIKKTSNYNTNTVWLCKDDKSKNADN